jgi:hypothetical protein
LKRECCSLISASHAMHEHVASHGEFFTLMLMAAMIVAADG